MQLRSVTPGQDLTGEEATSRIANWGNLFENRGAKLKCLVNSDQPPYFLTDTAITHRVISFVDRRFIDLIVHIDGDCEVAVG